VNQAMGASTMNSSMANSTSSLSWRRITAL
jgi:hypothetical protein